MDYEVINAAIGEIISIVKNSKKEYYNERLMENLTTVLLGYYLVFGPNIFKTIVEVLETLNIYRCEDDFDYICKIKAVDNTIPNETITLQPITIMSNVSDKNGRFIGCLPYIVYKKGNDCDEILSIGHELSHVIDAAHGEILKHDDGTCDVNIAYSRMHLDSKNINNCTQVEKGFGEFGAVIVENKILEALKALDPNKIDYDFIKLAIYDLDMNKGNISDGYTMRYIAFKDLVDNPAFFELMKKYYHEKNSEEEFEKAYEALGSDLSYKRLKCYIMNMFSLDRQFDYLDYCERIRKEVVRFNKNTQYEVKKEFVIFH